MADLPIIAYENILSGKAYTMLAGVDNVAAPLSNAWTWDMSRIALPTTDALGTLSFSVNNPTGTLFGRDSQGFIVNFGRVGLFGGGINVTMLILGAARNNVSGQRFSGGTISILADNVEVFNQKIYHAKNVSAFLKIAPHARPAVHTVTISGLTPNATVQIPEIYLGSHMPMPNCNVGLNAYGDAMGVIEFKASSGRVTRSLKYIRNERRISWSNLDSSSQLSARTFIENALEKLQPFWLIALPDSKPSDCYLGYDKSKTTNMRLGEAMLSSFSLDFVELL